MKTDRVPFFSVIIPVYQSEQTLAGCIESVLNQGEQYCEIILVDDGSTDAGGEICDSYAAGFPHMISVIHKKNEGPLLARLDAVLAARGQYLMFLDSDDVYRPGLLKRVQRTVQTYQADIVIFNYYRKSQDGNLQLCEPQYPEETVFENEGLFQVYRDLVVESRLNALWQKCIRRELFSGAETFRKYGKMVIGEDKLLSLSILRGADKVVYLPEGLYEYSLVQGSISHRLSLRHYKDMETVYHEIEQYLSEWGLPDCREACCAAQAEFGLSCLGAVVSRILDQETSMPEFMNLASYINKDEAYWAAFRTCRKKLAPRKRLVCSLVRRRRLRLAFSFLYIGAVRRRIRNISQSGRKENRMSVVRKKINAD